MASFMFLLFSLLSTCEGKRVSTSRIRRVSGSSKPTSNFFTRTDGQFGSRQDVLASLLHTSHTASAFHNPSATRALVKTRSSDARTMASHRRFAMRKRRAFGSLPSRIGRVSMETLEVTAAPATDLGSMSYRELQKACKESGLKAAGTKAELVARLSEYFPAGNVAEPGQSVSQSSPPKLELQETKLDEGYRETAALVPDEMTYKELQQALKRVGQPSGGNTLALRARLAEYLAQSTEGDVAIEVQPGEPAPTAASTGANAEKSDQKLAHGKTDDKLDKIFNDLLEPGTSTSPEQAEPATRQGPGGDDEDSRIDSEKMLDDVFGDDRLAKEAAQIGFAVGEHVLVKASSIDLFVGAVDGFNGEWVRVKFPQGTPAEVRTYWKPKDLTKFQKYWTVITDTTVREYGSVVADEVGILKSGARVQQASILTVEGMMYYLKVEGDGPAEGWANANFAMKLEAEESISEEARQSLEAAKRTLGGQLRLEEEAKLSQIDSDLEEYEDEDEDADIVEEPKLSLNEVRALRSAEDGALKDGLDKKSARQVQSFRAIDDLDSVKPSSKDPDDELRRSIFTASAESRWADVITDLNTWRRNRLPVEEAVHRAGLVACEWEGVPAFGSTLLDDLIKNGIPLKPLYFDAVIAAWIKEQRPEDAVFIFDTMLQQGLRPSARSFSELLGEYDRLLDKKNIFKFRDLLWEELRASPPLEGNADLFDVLIRAMTNISGSGLKADKQALRMILEDFEKALVLGFVGQVDRHTFNSALRSCNLFGKWDLALEIFKAYEDWWQPDVEAYGHVIGACARGRRVDTVNRLLHEMKSKGVLPDRQCYVSTLAANGQALRWQKAIDTLVEMGTESNVRKDFTIRPRSDDYTYAIRACANAGRLEEAEWIMRMMGKVQPIVQIEERFEEGRFTKGRGMQWTVEQLRLMIHACVLRDNARRATDWWLQYQDVVSRDSLNTQTVIELFTMYVAHSDNRRASEMFSFLYDEYQKKPPDFILELLINDCDRRNNYRGAFTMMQMMPDLGITLQKRHYEHVILMMGRSNDVRRVQKIQASMRNRGVWPDHETYQAAINGSCAGGHIDLARKLYIEMKNDWDITPSDTIKGIILSRCDDIQRPALEELLEAKTEDVVRNAAVESIIGDDDAFSRPGNFGSYGRSRAGSGPGVSNGPGYGRSRAGIPQARANPAVLGIGHARDADGNLKTGLRDWRAKAYDQFGQPAQKGKRTEDLQLRIVRNARALTRAPTPLRRPRMRGEKVG